jgi:hypothetical protein
LVNGWDRDEAYALFLRDALDSGEHRRNGLGREHTLKRNGLRPSRAREQQPEPISSGI